ncbi:Site-specific DNA recombinase [Lachnospiraceae bacterium XBB1006]|nr:Site-specific DNA recombinase [Lachnospiraceae bacterium XBB1006]
MIAIYARQSMERKGSVSVATQIEICHSYMQEEPVVYADVGFSGKNLKRPKLTELLEACKEGAISAVYVYKLDRISRSLYDFAGLMELFNKKQIRFVSCTEWFDTQTPMGRAMLSMAATFAQLERETISQRVADVYAKQCRMGAYMGGQTPFGFSVCASGGLRVNPQEAAVIEELFERYATGKETYESLSDWCRQKNIRGKRGQLLKAPRIGEFLRNPLYARAGAGTLSYAKKAGIEVCLPIEGHGFYRYKEEKNLWVGTPHQGIVRDDVFVQVQCIRKKRFGEALRITQEHLDSKNFYAFNPEIDG